MSLIVSTPQQICNSPLNTSHSKMLFSFPKTKRFGADPKPVCAQICYDLPPVRTARSPGFGYGNKYDFTQNVVKNPAPNAYTLGDPNAVAKKKGFSFGLSREAMAVTGSQFVGDKTSPGPGAYDTRESNKVAISYTFKSRTAGPEGLTTVRHVPGPGAYPNYETITPKGQYFVSKFKNSGANTFAPARSSRFPELKGDKQPGPGTYDLGTTISPKGEYPVSKFKSSMVRSFGHSLRITTSQSALHTAPGPGTYRIPSEFGYYESAKTKSALDLSTAKSVDKKPLKVETGEANN